MVFAGCFIALLLSVRALLIYAAPKSIRNHRISLLLQRRELAAEIQAPEVGICPSLLSLEDVSKIDPSLNLVVTFKKRSDTYTIDNSNRMNFNAIHAHLPPKLSWKGKERLKYSVVFLDMDAPFGRNDRRNPPKQYLHWIVSHVDPTTFQTEEEGQQTVPYVPPTPPPTSTSSHRYVLVILAEGPGTPQFPISIPQGLNQTSGEEMVDRPHFDFRKFKEDNFFSVAGVEYFISPPLSSSLLSI